MKDYLFGDNPGDIPVRAIAVSDHYLYAGGSFEYAGDTIAPKVARIPLGAPSIQVIYGPVLLNKTFFVRFAAAPGSTITIEYTDGLSPSNWRKGTNLTASQTSRFIEFTEDASSRPTRFFRAVSPAY